MTDSLRKIKFFLPMLLVIAIALSGCTIGNTKFIFGEDTAKNLVFDMGSYGACSRQKALVYLLIAKAEYEEIFGDGVWEMQIEDLPMEEFVKNNTLSELLQRESMSALATQEGFELTEEQLESVSEAAKELCQCIGEEELSKFELTEQDIEEVFKAYMLSGLVYDKIAGTVDTQISDSEAKVITVQYFKVAQSVAEADASLIESVVEQAKSKALPDIASELSEAEAEVIDVCRGELAETLGTKAETAVFSLVEGEVSEVLTIDGYCYIFKSVSDYDSEKTEANKVVMLEKRRQDAFLNKYNEFMESSEYKINDELWDSISISGLGTTVLGGFYDICDKYGI